MEESLSNEKTACDDLRGQVAALEKRLMVEEERISLLTVEQKTKEEKLQAELITKSSIAKELEEIKHVTKLFIDFAKSLMMF